MLRHLWEQNVVICPFLDLGFHGQELMIDKLRELNTDRSATDANMPCSVACQAQAQRE